MVCKGKFNKERGEDDIQFITTKGDVIFSSHKEKYVPFKIFVSGCDDKYNYEGETLYTDYGTIFNIYHDSQKIMTLDRGKAMRPRCIVRNAGRDLTVKFGLVLGGIKNTIHDSSHEIASLNVNLLNKEYVININDEENPTLLSTILAGTAIINGFTDTLWKDN